MITQILIIIKHKFPYIWKLTDKFNSILFKLFFYKRFKSEVVKTLDLYKLDPYEFRVLRNSDLESVSNLILSQKSERLSFFNPHGFSFKDLQTVYNLKSFIMMGVFEEGKMVGYFFLRCFANKQCFVGRLIDESSEGKGIGRIMNKIMYNSGWNSGFHVRSTISKDNKWVMRSHLTNPTMKIIKELENNFLLVEFVKQKESL